MKAYATILRIVLFLLIQQNAVPLFAQYKPGTGSTRGRTEDVNVRAAAASVMVRPMETFGHSVNVVNTSDDPIKFRFQLLANPYFRHISSAEKTYFLQSGDSIAIGFKLINVNARVNGIYTVYFEMINEYDSTDKKLLEFNVEVYDGIDRQFVITTLQENILIRNEMREFEVPVLFKNLLPETKRVKFELSNERFSAIKMSPQHSGEILLPAHDTVINIRFLVTQAVSEQWQGSRSFTVYMKSLDDEQLGFFTFAPRWMFNKATYKGLDETYIPTNNLVAEYNFSQNNRDLFSHDVRLARILGAKETGIGFSAYYQEFNKQRFRTLTGTSLTYRGEQIELSAGNIYDNHELNLFGRGVKFKQYYDEDKNNQMEVWAVDQEVNLLRPFDSKQGAKQFSARFTTKNPDANSQLEMSSNYFVRPESSSKGHLHFGSYSVKLSETESLSATVGVSMESFHFQQSDSSLPGYIVKTEYSKLNGKWKYYGQLTRGSRNYAGQLQATTILSGYVSYSLTEQNTLSYRVQKNTTDHPAYTPVAMVGRFYYDYETHELNFSRIVENNQFYVRPYYLRQAQLYSFDPVPQKPVTGKAYRLSTGVYGHANWLHYNFDLDAGQYQAKNLYSGTRQKSSYQLSGSLGFFNLILDASIQRGPNYITDLTNLKDTAKEYYNRSFNLSFQKTIFKKLNVQTTAGLIQNAITVGNIYNINQAFSIDLGKGLSAHAEGYYFKYGSSPSTVQVRAGVRKVFSWEKAEDRRARVTIQLFEDRNNNGIREAGENWVAGVMVRFDDLTLVTDNNGMIQIQKVTRELHKVSVIYGTRNTQHYLEHTYTIDKNTRIQLGVPPQYTIKGIVKFPPKKYDESERLMDGIKVILVDAAGKEFTTFTTNGGSFELQVPPGTYHAYLPEVKKINRQQKDIVITVDQLKGYESLLEMDWADDGRKVIIKKL